MKLYITSRISRRLGERLLLKADRDASPKSAMVKRPYPPGMHQQRRGRGLSEFGIALKEKQKLRYTYGVSDAGLKRVVAEASRATHKMKTEALVELLERRLDSVLFRMGLAGSRRIARQVISHGHVFLNGKGVRTPSITVKPGDVVSIRPASRTMPLFQNLETRLKNYEPPAWLTVEPAEWRGTVARVPSAMDTLNLPDVSRVIEFYSR